jgi:hypothetical protein
MKKKQPKEADLEARIGEALAVGFLWLPAEALEYQTKFSLQIGRGILTVGGESVSRLESREDVLVSHNGKPLAVLELKRPGQPLTESDEKQGVRGGGPHRRRPWNPARFRHSRPAAEDRG